MRWPGICSHIFFKQFWLLFEYKYNIRSFKPLVLKRVFQKYDVSNGPLRMNRNALRRLPRKKDEMAVAPRPRLPTVAAAAAATIEVVNQSTGIYNGNWKIISSAAWVVANANVGKHQTMAPRMVTALRVPTTKRARRPRPGGPKPMNLRVVNNCFVK